jgi:YD repeat-containing protein
LDAPQGNVVEEKDFDGLTRRYYRDLSGQAVSLIRPNGKERREETYEYLRRGLDKSRERRRGSNPGTRRYGSRHQGNQQRVRGNKPV